LDLDRPSVNDGIHDQVGRLLQIENSRVDLHVVLHTLVDRGRLLTSGTPGSVSSLYFPRRRNLWSASHSYPEHIEAPKRSIPASLICRTFQSDFVKDEVNTITGESSDGFLKSRIEVYEATSTSDHAFMN